MDDQKISSDFLFTLQRVKIYDVEMAYIDAGPTDPVQPQSPAMLFLHGNPTSSYVWRNIIPHVSSHTRCIAPDLVGMGQSDKPSHLSYRFVEHAFYLDEFIASVILPANQKIVLVVEGWGSALGFHWARRHAHLVAGLAFLEFIPPIPKWDMLDKGGAASLFKAFRGPSGRKLIIEENFFVERFLPESVVRALTEKEMDYYRAPYLDPDDREAVYRWPNEVPIEGQPSEVYAIAVKYHTWLLENDVPKLFFWANPGSIISEELAGFYLKALRNTENVHIGPGKHFLQEDNPHLIGRELASWLEHTIEGKGETKV